VTSQDVTWIVPIPVLKEKDAISQWLKLDSSWCNVSPSLTNSQHEEEEVVVREEEVVVREEELGVVVVEEVVVEQEGRVLGLEDDEGKGGNSTSIAH